jgi:hypothetical protein
MEGKMRSKVDANATGHSPITVEAAVAMSLAELLMTPVNIAVISVARDPAAMAGA